MKFRRALSAATAAVTAAAVTAAVLIAATPAAAQGHRTTYTGTEYDQGGTSQPISGQQPAIDAKADQITATTDAMLRDVARQRATLPYGSIDSDPHTRPQLTTYPAPTGTTASDQYAVTVRQGLRATNSFVYKVNARKTDTNREQDTSWTSFSFAGPVLVAVRKLTGSATGCLVRPSSAGIHPVFAGNTCYFALTGAANVSVEFTPNTTNPVPHPMLVFANPPETDVPPATDPNVLYLGPGVHDLGRDVPLHDGETVYVAGGAWVKAAFKATGVHNVVFRGRGIIDGLFLDTGDQDANKNEPGLIDLADASNVVVDGLTFVDGPRFNVRVLGNDITVHNIKVMSWWYSTDCIWAGADSLVEGNFCKVNDDSLKPMTGPSVIRDNVVWQLENGAPFMISWNVKTDQSNFHVYDNDVIHAEHYWLSPQAIFRSRHASPGHLQDYLFENIRVEDANWRLFYIILENNKWYDPSLGYGQISALIFRNITAETPFTMPSVVAGIDPDHRVYDASFVNVDLNGTCVSDAAGGNFQIDPATTDQIRIMKDTQHPCGGRR
ncbi:hypothetical protein [Rugosimonospora africana]|uniref:Uncharacterized protein n=1 Tax=Rugosimonospora africana TaxID=556532 RepID=A0A8J3QQ59_9ACTN|nr:hypothetical protein [Rugosimonospora africana]GIH14879.1 hypothetical protein Raf01_30510 [Rugosimonospora africana]